MRGHYEAIRLTWDKTRHSRLEVSYRSRQLPFVSAPGAESLLEGGVRENLKLVRTGKLKTMWRACTIL